jgi:hypothetical protein
VKVPASGRKLLTITPPREVVENLTVKWYSSNLGIAGSSARQLLMLRPAMAPASGGTNPMVGAGRSWVACAAFMLPS